MQSPPLPRSLSHEGRGKFKPLFREGRGKFKPLSREGRGKFEPLSREGRGKLKLLSLDGRGVGERVEQWFRAACGVLAERWPDAAGHANCKGGGQGHT